MSDPRQCDDTLSGNIPNTLPHEETLQQPESDKSDKKRQKRQLRIESDEEDQRTKYQPYDLKLLTFKPIGSNQEVDIWHAQPSDFHAYIQQYAKGFTKVNTAIWPLAERLAVVNVLWEHYQKLGAGHLFPFKERQHLVPDVDAANVPDVDGDTYKSASEAAQEGA